MAWSFSPGYEFKNQAFTRPIVAACIGNCLELFDLTVFGFFADAFGRRKPYFVYLLIAAALVPIYGMSRSPFWLLVLASASRQSTAARMRAPIGMASPVSP